MSRRFVVLILMLLTTISSACTPRPESSKGFSLPEGDPVAGEQTFVELQCQSCHTIDGVALPAVEEVGEVLVDLGGETSTVKTYGQLVTAIINPSHTVAPGYRKSETFRGDVSLMTVYNDVMTVQQLIDLVAFLQSRYEVVPPENLYLMP